jgi:hypothetical protein
LKLSKPNKSFEKLKKSYFSIDNEERQCWYKKGLILYELQQNKELWPKNSDTFEDVIKEHLKIADKRYGYRQIDASLFVQKLLARVVKNGEIDHQKPELSTGGLPQNEGQVRPLFSLENDSQRVFVWDNVLASGKTPTAKVVQEEVDKFKESLLEAPVLEFSEPKLLNITSSKREVLYTEGKNDECYTPDYAVKAIIPYIPEGSVIWCPFDDDSSYFVRMLQDAGFRVNYSHIRFGQDFYNFEPEYWDIIISNPPFTAKRKIFERALSFNKPFALIMSNTWLSDSAPKKLFKDKDLQLLMFYQRMKFLNQDNSTSKITFSSSYFCWNFLPKQIIMADLQPYGYC